MKKALVAAGILLVLALSGCNPFGSRLPSELLGSWSYDNGYYSQTFTFEARHMYYQDYATNTGAGASWDEEIVGVNADANYFITSYDCWSWYVSGSTLYLVKEAYSDSPDPALPASWWSDVDVSKYTLSKD